MTRTCWFDKKYIIDSLRVTPLLITLVMFWHSWKIFDPQKDEF